MAIKKDNISKISIEPFNRVEMEDSYGLILLACEKYRNCKLTRINPNLRQGVRVGPYHNNEVEGIHWGCGTSYMLEKTPVFEYPCCSLRKGIAERVLKTYMNAYEKDAFPLQSYKTFKTFNKSIQATLDFLEKMQNDKGNSFYINKKKFERIAKDVRFFTDLAYLHQRKYLELTVPADITEDRDGFIEDIGIVLKFSVMDIKADLIPPEPDARYFGLELFISEQYLRYQSTEVAIRVSNKSTQILIHMIKEPKPLPLKSAIKKFGIKARSKDKSGRGALEAMLRKSINTKLETLGFPKRLGVTDTQLCWKRNL